MALYDLAQCPGDEGMQYVMPTDLHWPLSIAAAVYLSDQGIASPVEIGKFDGEPPLRLANDSRRDLTDVLQRQRNEVTWHAG